MLSCNYSLHIRILSLKHAFITYRLITSNNQNDNQLVLNHELFQHHFIFYFFNTKSFNRAGCLGTLTLRLGLVCCFCSWAWSSKVGSLSGVSSKLINTSFETPLRRDMLHFFPSSNRKVFGPTSLFTKCGTVYLVEPLWTCSGFLIHIQLNLCTVAPLLL